MQQHGQALEAGCPSYMARQWCSGGTLRAFDEGAVMKKPTDTLTLSVGKAH